MPTLNPPPEPLRQLKLDFTQLSVPTEQVKQLIVERFRLPPEAFQSQLAFTADEVAALSKDAQAKLRHTFQTLKCLPMFELIWKRQLTQEERSELGGNMLIWAELFIPRSGPMAMLLAVRPMHRLRAISKMGRAVGLILDPDYFWLDSEIAKVDPEVPLHAKSLRREVDMDDVLRSVVQSTQLVLVQGNGDFRLYWHGVRLHRDWGTHPILWELLTLLVRKAGRAVVTYDELSEHTSPRTLVDRRSKLKKLIDLPDLDQCILPGNETGTCRLHLPHGATQIIQLEIGQYLLQQ